MVMNKKIIDSMEKWNILSAALREKGYSLWQMQYRWSHPEGFHAWFWRVDSNGKMLQVEVITFDQEIQNAILEFDV
jgi:hypothetical protein